MKENLKKYSVEIIGTFFLVLTIACCSFTGNALSALAIASVLMVMIYAGGHISGGHYNPAVSLAACIRGALPFKEFVPYMIAQFIGGALAVGVFYLLIGQTQAFSPATYSVKALLIAEIIFTFALCYVVLQTATTKQTQGNSYYGLAIGFIVFAGAISVGGSFCAGAFNPAVALSLGMLKTTSCALIGYTILANFIGALLAGWIFKLVCNEPKED